MPPSGAKFPTCWKMHHRALHAIFIHRRGFSTFRRECIASKRVAGPIQKGPVVDLEVAQIKLFLTGPCVLSPREIVLSNFYLFYLPFSLHWHLSACTTTHSDQSGPCKAVLDPT